MDFEANMGLIFPDSEPPINTANHPKISVCEPSIGDLERDYVKAVMDSGWVSSLGPEVKRFEAEFAEKIGSKYAVSCSNGTAALHLAVAALGIGPGDEVILPTFTMIATLNAVLYCGATPVLVDADRTFNMDVYKLQHAITERTKAIIAVHIYGVPCNMLAINHLAKKHNLWVIEDTAESHGALYDGKMTGSIGDIGTFSSYANKLITTGEGGVLTTDDPDIALRIRALMNHAFSPERHFCHRLFGYNYRMTALQAALGRAQLARWDELIGERLRVKDRYLYNLRPFPGVGTDHWFDTSTLAKPVCWMFGVLVDRDIKNRVRRTLALNAVETRNFFVPMHLQPVHYERFKGQRFPKSEMLMECGFYLPSSAGLTNADVDYVSEHLLAAV
jgi:perosamine synthetase